MTIWQKTLTLDTDNWTLFAFLKIGNPEVIDVNTITIWWCSGLGCSKLQNLHYPERRRQTYSLSVIPFH
jgi:hypothetical protein